MEALHNSQKNASLNLEPENLSSRPIVDDFQKLVDYLDYLKLNKHSLLAEEHEEIIVRLTQELGRSALCEMLTHYDTDEPMICINEQTYRRKHKAPKTYQSAFGSVSVERHVYVNRKKGGDGKSICPLELQVGVIEHYWTPIAAKNAAWALAHLTPQEVEELLLQFGKMDPSRSSLDRLPKTLLKKWEPFNMSNHHVLISDESVPEDAVTVAVSLDGVMVGMKPEKTEKKPGKNRQCEWREASCGTLSFFDKEGERLSTIQYGRMPEHKKRSLKTLLQQNLDAVLKQRPKLKVVHVADGAQDNWCFFDEEMHFGFQLTDFYHACQYLKSAYNAAYPNDLLKATEKFNHYKTILRDENKGIEQVLRALRYLRQKIPGNDNINSAVTYFTNNQHRMKYAEAKEENYPIGSGVVEAACKTLVGQRMKRSGMSWNLQGGQSILTLRSLVKSQRFDKAWRIMANQYHKPVKTYDNVVSLFG